MSSQTISLNMTRDVTGAVTYGRQPSNTMQNTTLSANTAQSFTVPTDANSYLCVFSYNPTGVWVSTTGVATLPGASVASTISECNPGSYQLAKGTTISMITSNTTSEVGVAYYAVS